MATRCGYGGCRHASARAWPRVRMRQPSLSAHVHQLGPPDRLARESCPPVSLGSAAPGLVAACATRLLSLPWRCRDPSCAGSQRSAPQARGRGAFPGREAEALNVHTIGSNNVLRPYHEEHNVEALRRIFVDIISGARAPRKRHTPRIRLGCARSQAVRAERRASAFSARICLRGSRRLRRVAAAAPAAPAAESIRSAGLQITTNLRSRTCASPSTSGSSR